MEILDANFEVAEKVLEKIARTPKKESESKVGEE